MGSAVTVYTLLYIVISVCFIFRPSEFVAAGITIEYLFGRCLGSEYDNFIMYNMKRSALTLFIHSLLPLGYFGGLTLISAGNYESPLPVISTILMSFSFLFPLITGISILKWTKKDWQAHPIVKNLSHFNTLPGPTAWMETARDINMEFKRVDKLYLKTSSICWVIVTDNWIIKKTLYNLYVAHQSDSVMILFSADVHELSPDSAGAVQFANIDVRSTRPGVKSFSIKLNTVDLRTLDEKMRRPITILQGVVFHKNTIEQFLDVFHETIKQNPTYKYSARELDNCIGCMSTQPGVKFVKNCTESDECSHCFCKPMWCVECIGKWFASRQEQDKPETWMSSTCTCPLCRSVFCILDVCPLELSDAD